MRLICLSLAAIFLAAAFYVPAIAGTLEPPPPGNPGEPPLPPLPPPPPPPPLPPAPAKPEKKEPDNTPPDAKKIDEAIKKGVEWLAKTQDKNGSFKVRYGTSYPMGCTALALLALLKSGVDPRSPVIGRGFKYLEDLPLSRMYCVSIYVMALEALYAPSKKQLEKTGKEYTTVLRGNIRKRSSGHDMKHASKCVEWIISKQQENVWRYPTGGEDLSNTQYALLAIYSGMRMGMKVSPKVFRLAGDYMIVNQEKEGPEVKPFPVPAADFSLKDLRKLEKEIRAKLREAKRKPEAKKDTRGPSTTVVEDPYSRFGVERRAHKMFARGWSYTAPKPPPPGQKAYPQSCTGSMTTAGLACSVIIKAGLEGSKYYPKTYGMLLDKAIRDGAAWVSEHFTVTTNPYGRSTSGSTHYLYYYLYGLERAGMLTLCMYFGEHDWYNKGAKYIIEQQDKEGFWEGYKTPARQPQPGQPPPAPQPPNHVDTCFALLFLKRATVPVISIPPEIYTGGDLFGDKKEKKDKPGEEKEAPEAEPEKQESSPEKTPDETGKETPPEKPAVAPGGRAILFGGRVSGICLPACEFYEPVTRAGGGGR